MPMLLIAVRSLRSIQFRGSQGDRSTIVPAPLGIKHNILHYENGKFDFPTTSDVPESPY